MKKIFFLLLMLSAFSMRAQQSFSGFRVSPYGGIYSIINNPAEAVGGMHKKGVNLLSFDGIFSNNKVPLSLSGLSDSFEKFTKTGEGSVFSHNDLDADFNLDILGPSAFFNIGNKNAIAITSRVRAIADVRGIDAKILESYFSDTNLMDLAAYPSIKIDNQHILVNAFSEVGASWGSIVFSNEKHTIKVGVTLKAIQGIISSRAGFDDFSGAIKLEQKKDDVILNISGTGDFSINNGGINIWGEDSDSKFRLQSSASTFVFDAGFAYEYRKEPCPDCEKTPYDFKFGLAFTDAGRLNYTTTENSKKYSINSSVTSVALNLDNLQRDLDRSNLVSQTSLKGKTFTSSLPVALRIYADARILRKFFVDFSGQFASSDKKDKIYNATYANSFVLTPRYESRWIGFYLPIANTQQVGTTIGTGLRVGPLVVGSSSIISNLFSNNTKGINVFAGITYQWH
ncbi:hypothetical protein [Capnocytophaga canis]|uniref:DUF5723 domain-containing protein n=1 Tax=Capnocytophaga canis TaxID=1848903 RepID=A0A0B7IPM9_9FLAO|nr:hypothetical protein [Capnocytophaga canis]CEN53760.1 conserved exported hypothetical protein [Capnocytophaga canis]